MKRKTTTLLLLLFSVLGISQEKIWNNRLEFQTSASFSKVKFIYSPGNRPFKDFERQTSINYAVGWNTSFRVLKNLSLESGVSLMRRKNKITSGFDHCYPNPENRPCSSIYYSTRNRRHHLLNIPLRVRFQKQLGKKLTSYWSGSLNNYLHLSTTYRVSDFKTKDKVKTHHGYSVDTALGVRYPLAKRCTVELEVNSRLFEKYRQTEIAYGNTNEFDSYSFNNINMMLSVNYTL